MNPQLQWFEAATGQYQNPDWLYENTGALFDTLDGILANPTEEEAYRAVDVLLLVYPYVLPYGDIKQWSKLLQNAVDYLHERLDTSQVISLNALYLTTYQDAEIADNIDAALKRARKRLKPRFILEAYISLFRAYVYQQSQKINREVVFSALQLARQINDPVAYGRLYVTLALVFDRWGEFDRALDYARMAHDIWVRLNDTFETAVSAYCMGITYNRLRDLDAASHWLDRAANLLAKTDNRRQYGLLAHEMGILNYSRGEAETALQWFQIAVDELVPLDEPYALGIHLHSLGMAQNFTGHYDEALQSLQRAMEIMEAAEDEHQIGHISYSMAHLHARRGEVAEAFRYLDRTASIYEVLPSTPMRDHITERMQKLRAAIESGDKLPRH